ncbi:MAG: 30S ribosomal protein S8 [Thaumarchaeota archaeon]|uniref:Putative ribosomal protein S8 n=1 Tax=uncultured marine microorganism HF4000_ANIW141A21 TaxID=455535 RepID=B3T589_9ZZZZ|nr:putative ribosomal protein S8 [uncultured marine microorganism HF4000_ANIW141A21]MCZ6613693.1 30S ribosomal protein S8 [Nitrososphaerota archaeon]
MPAQNILSNLFTTLYNNELRNKKECLVIPASKLASEILRIIQKNKYIGEFEYIDDGLGGKFKIQLLGRINKCGLISPRLAIQKNEFERWERNYLPAVGVGILVITTSEGVLAHSEAKSKGIGGRLLGYVY